MSTWPNRGASGGPCGGGWKRERESKDPSNQLDHQTNRV
jgi:hypothetical protein